MDCLFAGVYHSLFPFENICLFLVSQSKTMKYLLSFLLLIPISAFSQRVFSTSYRNQADVNIFVVDYENQCDLKVYKVDYANQANGNNGLWHFVDYANQADKKIFFTSYANQSDLKIYFVKYRNQAGWRNKSKQHLLY